MHRRHQLRHVHAQDRAGDYTGARVRFRVTWAVQANDYDVYVHQGSNDGAMVQSSTGGAPSTVEENTFDLNGVVTAGVNDTYTVHVVFFTVASLDPYHGVVSLEAIPTTPTRTATVVTSAKTRWPTVIFGVAQKPMMKPSMIG